MKYKCDHCESTFSEYKIDPEDDWEFDHIIQYDGVVCKACIYLMLYKHYRKKVREIQDVIGKW